MAGVALVLFVVMFLAVFVARTVILRRATGDGGIRAGVLAAAAGSVEWWAGWGMVLAMAAGVAAPAAELAGLEPLVAATAWRGTGLVLAVLGIVAILVAQSDMGTEWRIGVDEDERTGLVTGGVFSIVRNPVFTAMIVTATGLTLMVTNPIAVAGLALLVVSLEVQVRLVEEPHLRRLHGDSYRRYEARVGRFVPAGTLSRVPPPRRSRRRCRRHRRGPR